MNIELIKILLAWAVFLSQYDKAPVPDVEEKPHSYFVKEVCGGKECNVYGWYNKGTIYLDKRLNESASEEIAVHEIVHYLQDVSNKWDESSCKDRNLREKEAYLVQTKYSIEVMSKLPLRMSNLPICKEKIK